MIKPPSRNHKSKGVKVKHVLQTCVLLAVCFWLIYQVNRYHDKKKAFGENDANISLKTRVHDEILEFGRKGLHPRLEETSTTNEKHYEEETGVEEDGNDNKHEEENHEEYKKAKEDEGRGAEEDEIDEQDVEKSEMAVEHKEDLIDEEKEREGEEKEAEDKEGQDEDDSSLEDHDNARSTNAHEAREEHYRGDDASSAVTQETEATSTGRKRGSLENSNYNTEVNNLTEENNSLNSAETILGLKSMGLKAETAENGSSRNATRNEDEGHEIVSPKMEDSSPVNTTMTIESSTQPEVGHNSTEESSVTNYSSLQNETGTKPGATEAQNAIVGNITSEYSNLQTIDLGQEKSSSMASDSKQTDSNLTRSTDTKNAEAATGESSNFSTASKFSVSENVRTSNASIEVVGHLRSSTVEGNINATLNEKSETSKGTDESLDSSKTGVSLHDDPIDNSESSIPLEKDLDTSLEIRTKGINNKDAAAE